jgi:exodeoxyribonuclease V beta subunit
LDEGGEGGLPVNEEALDKYNFPKGASAGSFLHSILEVLTFDDLDSLDDVIEQKMQWYGIEEQWKYLLIQWIPDILNTALDREGHYRLSDLAAHQYLSEMEFYLPINQLDASHFNQLINQWTDWNNREYQFNELTGMLKGFIDLVYEIDGCYYVADYKSNHLGSSVEDYAPGKLKEAMEEHDYHLQGIIYTLALHRWLKQRLPDYCYEHHIGGAVYLFLRGMASDNIGSGLYYFKPAEPLILGLDRLFSGFSVDELSVRVNQPATEAKQLGLNFE